MNDVKQTPPRVADPWVLYVFPKGNAKLCYCLPDDSYLQGLPAHLTRLIILLQNAYDQDVHLCEDVRGFRQVDYIAKVFDGNPLIKLEPSTIRHYLGKLCRKLEWADLDVLPFPLLIERARNFGVRLVRPVKIIFIGCANTSM